MLDELAGDCAYDGVYEFLLDATPLPFTHAVGAAGQSGRDQMIRAASFSSDVERAPR